MINDKIFKGLAGRKGENLISLYMPTYRAGHSQEDQLRFKNKLKEARLALEERGMESRDIKALLSEADALLEKSRFWDHLSDGLAVFVGKGFFHYEILPLNFEPYLHIGSRFYLRPMLPVLSGESRFFLLALSQNEVRFFEGHQYSITPVKISDLVPDSMKSIFEMSDVKEHLQHHSGKGVSGEPIFHGQGSGKDDQSIDLKKYFYEIDKGLMEMLHDEQPPMVIAAVDYLVPIYREVNNYPHLLEEHVGGNPENDGPVLLHEKGWEIVSRHYEKEREADTARFHEALGSKNASSILPDIVAAAINGRVDTLFVDKTHRTFGKYDTATNGVIVQQGQTPDNRELLEYAAVQTYLQGGRVYTLSREELPESEAAVNAIFRY